MRYFFISATWDSGDAFHRQTHNVNFGTSFEKFPSLTTLKGVVVKQFSAPSLEDVVITCITELAKEDYDTLFGIK